MKKTLTHGTFDLFHIGYLEILRRAKELGDYLVVGVSTDEFNAIKGKVCVYPFEQRIRIVESIKYVDEVIPENNWDPKRDNIITKGINILTMGNDWDGKFDSLKNLCQIVYLQRTEGISTSEAIRSITNRGT